MVGFVYNKSQSADDLAKQASSIFNQPPPENTDDAESSLRDIKEFSKQLEISKNSISGDSYTEYKRKVDETQQDTQNTAIQIAQARQAVNAAGSDQTADQDQSLPAVNLSAEERDRFNQNQTIARDGDILAVSVSGSNTETSPEYDPDRGFGFNEEGVFRVDVSGGTLITEPDDGERSEYGIRIEGSGTRGTNKLGQYKTSTYGLSLHFMTIPEYNAFVASRTPYSPKNHRVIIASGGRRNDSLVRNKNFQQDMYITDLKMLTVIGVGKETRGTNAVNIEFTIVEPYSASLLERLVKTARENNIQGWIEMPLILQIDFFGHDEDGNYAPTPLPGLSKFICIKLTNLQLEITSKGAEYKCLAIPLTHSVLSKNSITVPVNFELTAKTVGEFFSATGNEIGIDLNVYENTNQSANSETRDEAKKSDKNAKPKSYSALSLADALNEYQKALVKGRPGKKYQETADEFIFVITDKKIADAQIFVSENHNLTQAPMQNDKIKSSNIQLNKGVISINAGTNLLDVINYIVSASSLFRDQTSINKSATTAGNENIAKNQPLLVHKIIPKIEFTDEWDSIRKQYKKKIYYYIKAYTYHNTKYPNANKSLPVKVDRVYEYIYTGMNQEIFDLKIEFNTLFFQALTSFETKTSEDNLDVKEEIDSGFDPYTGAGEFGSERPLAPTAKTNTSDQSFMPLKTVPVNNAKASGQLTDGSKKSIQAVDLWSSIYNRAGGDMVNLTIDIAGDPDFIKQDDVFYPPSISNNDDDISTSSDKRQIFIDLRMKIPTDINLSTGLYDFEKENSSFNGIYEVLSIENVFKDGAFKQKLQCVRLFGQEDKRQSRGSSSTALTESSTRSDNEGLGISNEEYEQDLDQAAKRAYEESQGRANENVADAEQGYDESYDRSYEDAARWAVADVLDPQEIDGLGV